MLRCRSLASPRVCSSASYCRKSAGEFAKGRAASSMVEQVTLNHPVPGSSPGRLTIHLDRDQARHREGRGEGGVSELVDEHDLGSCAARRRSSSLLFPTTPTALIIQSDTQSSISSSTPGWTKGE